MVDATPIVPELAPLTTLVQEESPSLFASLRPPLEKPYIHPELPSENLPLVPSAEIDVDVPATLAQLVVNACLTVPNSRSEPRSDPGTPQAPANTPNKT